MGMLMRGALEIAAWCCYVSLRSALPYPTLAEPMLNLTLATRRPWPEGGGIWGRSSPDLCVFLRHTIQYTLLLLLYYYYFTTPV